MDQTVVANQKPSPPSNLSATPGYVQQRKANPIDRFLRRHEVDVGKSLAVLIFAAAVMAFYTMAGEVIASLQIPFPSSGPISGISFNLGAPLYLILGIGLWRHKSWSRTLLLVFGWLSAALFTVMLLAIPFTGTANVKFVIGSEAIKNPPVWKAIAFWVLVAPLYVFLLAVLHSKEARKEFSRALPQDELFTGPPHPSDRTA